MAIAPMTWPTDIPKPQSILFCCTMNAIRSPMAEGLLKQLCGTAVYVDSAGVRESEQDNFMVQAMQEIGIDMSNHNNKIFDNLQDSYFDLIVAMSAEAQHHAIELTRTMACEIWFWRILDPSIVEGSRDAKVQAYAEVREQVRAHVEELIDACGLTRVSS